MKRIIISLLAVLALTCMKAAATNEAVPVIENPYLETVLESQVFASSPISERDFLITAFLSENQKKFNPQDILRLKKEFDGMSDAELLALTNTEFKDPTLSLVLSVLVGGLGVDRFYIGDIGAGVGKLLTGGGLGVWWLVDLFVIQKKTKKNNSEDLDETMMLNKAILAK